ncbi:MAG: hypothetical protein IJ496_02450 [Ruminococcus sp.]|nr:hypothetical protein [Ruminococcus sp.]
MQLNISHKKMADGLYYAAYTLYVFCGVFAYSMISYDIGFQGIHKYAKLVSLLLVCARFLLITERQKSLLYWICGFFVTLVLVVLAMESTIPIFVIFITVGAFGADPKLLAKIYFVISAFILSVSMVLSQIGIIEDRTFPRPGSNVLRHSMGMKYITIWAALMFFLIAVYIYIRGLSITKKEIAVLFGITLFTYVMANSRLEFMAMLVLLAAVLFYKKLRKSRLVQNIMTYSFLIGFGISFLLTFAYMLFPAQLAGLDDVFSDRLSLSAQGIEEYGFSLFGEVIPMQGYGEIEFDWSKGYFFLDSFYINYTLQYGLVFAVLLLVFITIISVQLKKKKNTWLLMFVFFAAMHGVIISSIMAVEMCPFFVIAVAGATSNIQELPFDLKRLRKKRIRVVI